MTTTVIVIGILTWVLAAILLSLLLARANRLSRPRTATIELPLIPAVRRPARTPAVGAMARFPAEPARFVGHAEAMAAAGLALTPGSGRTAVVFHGMAGVGKTTCAIELAHRHRRDFGSFAFWSAPSDPDQCEDALRLLAMALADHGFAMVEEIATRERLERFLPTLATGFASAGLLLVLDNVDTLLTPDGHWRDHRWAPLISALTDEAGSSRVIVTSRIVPAGLSPGMVVSRPIHALSQDETLMLVGELPGLCASLRSVSLARQVLTLTQGHPQLLELADASAGDPARLAYQLADLEEAIDAAPLGAFLTWGHSALTADQLRQTVTTWITTVAATAPVPTRLLLQALCRVDETDRTPAVIGANWPGLWRRWNQPGEPPPLAAAITPLVTAALITTDPIDDPANPDQPGRYRIHPGVVAAIHTVTPEPVAAAVDAQLTAWWAGVADSQAIELPQEDTSRFMTRASLAAARYLMRQHDWNTASCLLERALIRDRYTPLTSLAVIPPLRRIAEATGAAKDLVVLGAALRKLDPSAAALPLRAGYDRAITDGDHQLASTSAGELVSLLRDLGELGEALILATEKIEHTRQAGFGCWTQLSDQGRRLQILNLLGRHEQVLEGMPALRSRMADLADHRADNDRVDPWNAREGILDIGRLSAMALERWDEALELNDEIASTQRRRGADPAETAHTRFNDYLPLLRLGRLSEADRRLRECQDACDITGDLKQLAVVYAARAELADTQHHRAEAVEHQRSSLRLRYHHPDPREIAAAHHKLADYLSRANAGPAERWAHRVSASLINHLTGDACELTRTLGTLADELRTDRSSPDASALTTTLPQVIQLVDADAGVGLGDLLTTLCPDPATAEHALADLLTILATAIGQPR